MEMKLGKGIANLRKAKNMTQEQLATSVGVSAPTVSKWETDSSYPDISLLCPIARALDTNVDTLLHFEDTLTPSEIADHMKDIMDFINKDDCYNAAVNSPYFQHSVSGLAAIAIANDERESSA